MLEFSFPMMYYAGKLHFLMALFYGMFAWGHIEQPLKNFALLKTHKIELVKKLPN